MKAYVITEEYDGFEHFTLTEVFPKAFKTFERAEQLILDNGFTKVDEKNDTSWNEYVSNDGLTFMRIKEVTIES